MGSGGQGPGGSVLERNDVMNTGFDNFFTTNGYMMDAAVDSQQFVVQLQY
jgi:hypothetical protein